QCVSYCFPFFFSIFLCYLFHILPRWSSGRNCDCWARGLGFDSRVGQSITGFFLVFLSSSTKSEIVSDYFVGRVIVVVSATDGQEVLGSIPVSVVAQSLELCPIYGRITPYYVGLVTQSMKSILYIAITCRNVHLYLSLRG
ncbi:hypothetical protein SFRURICE_018904, partial [Spodoptera frugiperda]